MALKDSRAVKFCGKPCFPLLMSFVTGGTGYAIFGDTPWPSEIFSRSDFIVSSRPHCEDYSRVFCRGTQRRFPPKYIEITI